MAKVIFLQKLAEEWLGVMYISAVLKSEGHECDIYVEALEKGDISDKALADSADIVCFSCLTSDYYWAIEKARLLKGKSRVLTVFGGTHVTLNPEESIRESAVDVICRGEGEYPMAELAAAVDRRADYSRIKNLWVKRAGKIERNEIRDLIGNLDALPFPDRELYAKYAFFKKRGKRPLHLSRGCPYSCSFCHNESKRKIYRGKGPYVRWRNQESVLAEIEDIKEKSFLKVLHIIDDSFGENEIWLSGFLKKLSHMEGKNLVIQASLRADKVTKEICEVFKDYGAQHLRLRFAVECGNEDYRRQVLKKNVSNLILIQAAELFHQYKISFVTYNILALPGETLPLAMETLRLNIRLKPSYAISFIFQPFPGTPLADYALREGFLTLPGLKTMGTPEHAGFYHTRNPLRQKDIDKVINLQNIFSVVVNFPVFYPLVNPVLSLPRISPILSLIYKAYLRLFVYKRRLRDKY
jgi:anaerobic magnesium-protoporphyrin IX monomethyl ester cyclase